MKELYEFKILYLDKALIKMKCKMKYMVSYSSVFLSAFTLVLR